jgi:hypothetical protein
MPSYTPTPTPTPAPTAQTDLSQLTTDPPGHRKVFSAPRWNADHETITVTNDGDRPITVRAWVDSPTKSVIAQVEPGATMNISTASVLTQDNQILAVGFDAYDNGLPIDSYKADIVIHPTTVPGVNATTTQASGFTLLIALASILGMAYLEVRRKKR